MRQRMSMRLVWLFSLSLLACGQDPAAAAKDTGITFGDSGLSDLGVVVEDGDSVAAADAQPDTNEVPTTCEYAGAWGCPCESASDCDSQFCVESADGKVCTKTCIETCPASWKCIQANVNDATFICLPKFASLCQPCAVHGDCGAEGTAGGDAKCLPRDNGQGFINGSFCGAPCKIDADCPNGFGCDSITLDAEAPTNQCVPTTGECGCNKSATAKKLTTACKRVTEFGLCSGMRQCSVDGLTLCNAALPTVEVCDSEDNDCDGTTDEDGALGCKIFYPDQDNDGAGIGQGACVCANPGPGYAGAGGDCNDLVGSIGPQAKEICNDIDDNCNGVTDEPQSSGCTVYYLDKDADGFGDPDDAACLCASKKTPDYVTVAGDCDDGSDKIKPGTVELCNKVDDNCDGKTDEENAQGCTLHYLDIDLDSYGPTDTGICICGPDAIYSTAKPGDCDDTNDKIKPSSVEICNNVDDDCNGLTDDGDAPKSCPVVAGVAAGCTAGVCGVDACPAGLFDVDGKYENGCECQADGYYGTGGSTCQAAIKLQPIGDGGTSASVTGNLMPGEAADWFTFDAIDGPDVNDCDTYDVRVRLMQGEDTYVLDLYRGSCAGKSQICAGEIDTSWTVAFGDKPAYGVNFEKGQKNGEVKPSPEPFPGGECKCTTTNDPKGPGLPGMNLCTDNSATFFFAVRYKPTQAPVCKPYQVLITNGPQKI